MISTNAGPTVRKCTRCGHPESDHATLRVCQAVIHYPSEDYPCNCSGEAPIQEGKCSECDHRAVEHVEKRRCSPSSGEICTCVEIL